MKISFLSIGIEVAETVVEVFSSEARPGADPFEVSGTHLWPLIPQRYRAEVSVILQVPDRPEAPRRPAGKGAEGQLAETLSPVLAETGRLGLKAVLVRGALLALPALAVLVAPRIARAALPAAGRNMPLRGWMKGRLPDPPPRLPG
jgi:hypothetical protein